MNGHRSVADSIVSRQVEEGVCEEETTTTVRRWCFCKCMCDGGKVCATQGNIRSWEK